MNNTIRKTLLKCASVLSPLGADQMPIPQPVSLSDQALADIIMELESIKDEEQDKYDNLQDTPFAESDRANDMESAIEQLDEAIDCLQSEPPDYVGAAESLRVI